VAAVDPGACRDRHIDPTKQAFAEFPANDRSGPIHMLKLIRLRAQARYPDGRQASGAETYAAHGRDSRSVFARLALVEMIRDPAYREPVKRRQASGPGFAPGPFRSVSTWHRLRRAGRSAKWHDALVAGIIARRQVKSPAAHATSHT